MLLNEVTGNANNPAKWGKAQFIKIFAHAMQTEDPKGDNLAWLIQVYFGDLSTIEQISKAILSVRFDSIDGGGHKYSGGYKHKFRVDHRMLLKRFRSEHGNLNLHDLHTDPESLTKPKAVQNGGGIRVHSVIVSPQLTLDGVKWHLEIFDGRRESDDDYDE